MTFNAKKLLKKIDIDDYEYNRRKVMKSYFERCYFSDSELINFLLELMNNKFDDHKVCYVLDYIYDQYFPTDMKIIVDEDGNNLPMLAVKTQYSWDLIEHMYSSFGCDINHVNKNNQSIMHIILESNYFEYHKLPENLIPPFIFSNVDVSILDQNKQNVIDIVNSKIHHSSGHLEYEYLLKLKKMEEMLYLSNLPLLSEKLTDDDQENYRFLKKQFPHFMLGELVTNYINLKYDENLILKNIKIILRQINLYPDSFGSYFNIDRFGYEIIYKSLIEGFSEMFILSIIEELFNYGFSVGNCNNVVDTALTTHAYQGSIYNIYQIFLNKGFDPLTETFEIGTDAICFMSDERYKDKDTQKLSFEMDKYKFIKHLKALCDDNNVILMVNDINKISEIYLTIIQLRTAMVDHFSLFNGVKIDFAQLIVDQMIKNNKNSINYVDRIIIGDQNIFSLLNDIINHFYNDCLDKINKVKTYKIQK